MGIEELKEAARSHKYGLFDTVQRKADVLIPLVIVRPSFRRSKGRDGVETNVNEHLLLKAASESSVGLPSAVWKWMVSMNAMPIGRSQGVLPRKCSRCPMMVAEHCFPKCHLLMATAARATLQLNGTLSLVPSLDPGGLGTVTTLAILQNDL